MADQTPPAEALGAPVQVVMPAALLPRLPDLLAVIGMRLYEFPTADGPTLMIAADMSQLRDPKAPTSLTTADVLEAWSMAVESLTETADDPMRRPKTRRKRQVPRNAA